MKSFSTPVVMLFICIFALLQVWAAPVKEDSVNAAENPISAQENNRVLATRDVVPVRAFHWIPYYPPFYQYPPPPVFPPYPPPPVYPPYAA
ncbi:uncharacterized protein EV154DRAFT_568945 [Mucor mucedo]|uniref:uncharacterized protein n=1 Tax=Mucor mucedo TaxID=29922 RepID=UPI002220570B|nr:uncharacterized protein EV154DRAFT_568945 [Mucor mucedo]KAI7878110.1 hypothetical protein EV154DRAFT_568945 [Mucor mucedo]